MKVRPQQMFFFVFKWAPIAKLDKNKIQISKKGEKIARFESLLQTLYKKHPLMSVSLMPPQVIN